VLEAGVATIRTSFILVRMSIIIMHLRETISLLARGRERGERGDAVRLYRRAGANGADCHDHG
jgi:hypothetical protein